MGVAIWLAGDRHLFVLAGVGAVVYVTMALVLRLFDDTEKEMLIRLVRRRSCPEPVNEVIRTGQSHANPDSCPSFSPTLYRGC